MGYAWPPEVIEDRLDRMVLEAYERARTADSKHRVGLRLATCMLGVDRVAYFDQLRGNYA
jgi:glutamate dehydrogenase/leucine dehydrogenase